jgi:hypothetical protein
MLENLQDQVQTSPLREEEPISVTPNYQELSSELSLPPIEEDKKLPRAKDAYEDAFYAVGSFSNTPIEDLKKAADDLLETGYSDLVSTAKQRWATEQDPAIKKTIEGIIADPTIPRDKKTDVLYTYSIGGYVSTDLKDKYIQRTASAVLPSHLDDQIAQEKNITTLPEKLELSISKKQTKVLKDLSNSISDTVIKNSKDIDFKVPSQVYAHSLKSLDLMKDTILDGIKFANGTLKGYKQSGAEAIALENLLFESVPWLADFTGRTLSLGIQAGQLKKPSFKEAADIGGTMKKELGLVYSPIVESFIEGQTKLFGVEKEYKESSISKGLAKLGEKIDNAATLVEKKTNGEVSKEAFIYGVDLFSIFAPHLLGKGYNKLKKAYKDRQPKEGEILPPEEQGPAGPGLEKGLSEAIEGEYTKTYDPVTGQEVDIAKTKAQAQREANLNKAETIDSETGKVVTSTVDLDLGIPPDSPIDVTNQTNPLIGSDISILAITDMTGQAAERLGTTRASIFFSSILPSLERRSIDLTNNPDLRAKLRALETELQSNLDYALFDPNALDIYEYYGDRLAIDRVINEAALPYLKLNDSLVNQTNFSFKGSLLFTRNEHFYFDTKEQVIDAYNNLVNSLEHLPESESKISIYDKKTGQRLTFDEFVKSKKYDTKDTLVPTEANELAIEWNFNKEYDALASFINGLAHHQVKLHKAFGGLDVTKLAMSKFGSENLFWTAKFPNWVQKQYARQAERAAFVSSKALITAQNLVSKSKNPAELNKLILDANDLGLDLVPLHSGVNQVTGRFERGISDLFPDLSDKQHKGLFADLAQWRVLNNHFYETANIAARYDLVERGFTSSIYRNGKYLGAVQTEFPLVTETQKLPKFVYDLESQQPVPFKKWQGEAVKPGNYDINGRQLVQLEKPVKATLTYQSYNPDGSLGLIKTVTNIYNFALTGTKVVVRDALPNKVLPKIPGHAPVLNKGLYIVMIEPKELTVNGIYIPDTEEFLSTRINSREAVGIAQTKKELKALKVELAAKYPDHKILERESTDSIKDVKEKMEIHKERLARAKIRGERLVGLHGVRPPVEEPLGAAIESYKNTVRTLTIKDADYALKREFMREYGHMVPKGTFPDVVEDIAYSSNYSAEERLKYSKAVALFNYRQSLELLGNWDSIDSIWQQTLHGIADILENVKVPPYILKELGNKGLPIAPQMRRLASTLSIALNPPKQWFVQTTQLVESLGITPVNAVQNVRQALAIRIAAMEDSYLFKQPGHKETLRYLAFKSIAPVKIINRVNDITEVEFNVLVDEFKKLIPSSDLNLLVADMFSDATKKMDPTAFEKAMGAIPAGTGAVVDVFKRIGYTNATLWNRLNLYIFALKDWKAKNPGKNWMLPAVKEQIAYDSWQLEGGMSKAGAYKWQTGGNTAENLASIVLQFVANNFKMTMNLLVENATILTPKQTAKLFASKLAWWGKYAVPGGAVMFAYLLDNVEDPNARKALTTLFDGIENLMWNSIFRLVTDAKYSDIDFASQLSSTDLHLLDAAKNVYYIFDADPGTEARFPITQGVSTIFDTFRALNNFYSLKKNLTPEQKDMAYTHLFMDLANTVRGFDNTAKAITAWTLQDLRNKDGVRYGINMSEADALGKFFGMPNAEEKTIIEFNLDKTDRSKAIDTLAKNWHRYIIKEVGKENPSDIKVKFQKLALYENFKQAMIDSGKWDELDIATLDKKFQQLDNYSQTNMKDSIFKFVYDHQNNLRTEEQKKAVHIVEDWLVTPKQLKPEQIDSIKDVLDQIKSK